MTLSLVFLLIKAGSLLLSVNNKITEGKRLVNQRNQAELKRHEPITFVNKGSSINQKK